MTPFASSFFDRFFNLLYAPLNLKENIGCKSSLFTKIVLLSLFDNEDAKLTGVFNTKSYKSAELIFFTYSLNMNSKSPWGFLW